MTWLNDLAEVSLATPNIECHYRKAQFRRRQVYVYIYFLVISSLSFLRLFVFHSLSLLRSFLAFLTSANRGPGRSPGGLHLRHSFYFMCTLIVALSIFCNKYILHSLRPS
ncbi:hypothetical protein K469DRAFT_307848 [Zopfia rhizophila CBS 207.26]|uniref:Uncharacterized protein n=1 Tax=Zopfia rhizophila CBS 207.26 TaxID=1314779 RepID=A0A6A6EJF2_9PEZI|nr:hypothetical protein K469DRAFT_307848 [Zopfia rhizophila CBS 207.26]